MQSRKFKPIHPSLLKAKKLNEKDFEKRGGDALELEQLSFKRGIKKKPHEVILSLFLIEF